MNIILIHGEHFTKSYERLKKLEEVARGRGWKISRYNKEEKLSFPEFLSVDTLFDEERFFIVEEIKLLGKKDIQWFKNSADKLKGNLIIYSAGTVTKTVIGSLPKINKVEEFKLPINVFNFLDSFYPGNKTNALKGYQLLKENEAPEFIMNFLSRHLRDIYWVKNDGQLPYPDWRIGKLKRQAAHFSNSKLQRIVENLSEIDVQSKLSKVVLSDAIDLVIATQLE